MNKIEKEHEELKEMRKEHEELKEMRKEYAELKEMILERSSATYNEVINFYYDLFSRFRKLNKDCQAKLYLLSEKFKFTHILLWQIIQIR